MLVVIGLVLVVVALAVPAVRVLAIVGGVMPPYRVRVYRNLAVELRPWATVGQDLAVRVCPGRRGAIAIDWPGARHGRPSSGLRYV